MKKQQILDNVRKMNKGMAVLEMNKMQTFLAEQMFKLGITKDDLDLVTNYVGDVFDAQELEKILLQEATADFVEGVTKLLRHIKMAEGYEAMGNINKNITEENFHLEDEVSKGEIVNGKVDSTQGEGESKEA
ncbi:hydrolase/hydrolase inhibitor [Bacillus phage vB_BanS_Sophrita]|uniref:Hydrolase/hydrolase inhibitor n=1 Tax=Bacillus phage vB_BanS_Sophrita TaxID=2894790 RepID=A0AAE9CDE8_9CAUD|nr:hydrolase/hydrolase inhibitor [Bacillus phage vB_BanS_Sophrita]UGO50700.1 hydrolase/hydrolase inhibitor [Bacillus phage vB_BanS_Sophrita]